MGFQDSYSSGFTFTNQIHLGAAHFRIVAVLHGGAARIPDRARRSGQAAINGRPTVGAVT